MTDHLPECYLSGPPNLCPMCEALRACEQRVRQEIDREAFVLDEGDPFRQAYRRGLDAAREAVERVSTLFEPLSPALAAIDALRGES